MKIFVKKQRISAEFTKDRGSGNYGTPRICEWTILHVVIASTLHVFYDRCVQPIFCQNASFLPQNFVKPVLGTFYMHVLSVVKVEIQRCRNCKFRFWPSVGGCGPIIDGFGSIVPPLVVDGHETTKLTLLSGNWGNQEFTSLTWILSRKNGKTVQKFNAQYAEMRLLA